MALQPWRIGKVIRIENETENTKRFWIAIPELLSFDFMPGQFVTLDLPIHEKANKRWRSYSIASWPNATNVFELIIVLLQDGAGTNYLFNEIIVGSELKMRGPQGVFILPEKIETNLFLICTGTGIAPFRAMVNHIIKNNIPHKQIYLIFGCRKISDTLYAEEFKNLAKSFSTFHYLPVFSREVRVNKENSFRTGYVHSVYEELCSSNNIYDDYGNIIIIEPALFYLCGWRNMVDEAKLRIQNLGYDKKVIHLELYG